MKNAGVTGTLARGAIVALTAGALAFADVTVHALRVAGSAQPSPAVEFAVLTWGGDSGVRTPIQVVVREAGAWRALWARHAGPQGTPPPVDFGQEMVIALFAGVQPPATRLAISRIVREPDRLVVYYTVTAMRPLPQPEMPAVRPFLMVRVVRSLLPVDFILQRTPPISRP